MTSYSDHRVLLMGHFYFAYLEDIFILLRDLARYSLTKKRTGVYYFDRTNFRIQHLFNFPSHGDTAFPAIAPLNANQYIFLNYSSVLNTDKDYIWIEGQLNKTRLYSSILTFK